MWRLSALLLVHSVLHWTICRAGKIGANTQNYWNILIWSDGMNSIAEMTNIESINIGNTF